MGGSFVATDGAEAKNTRPSQLTSDALNADFSTTVEVSVRLDGLAKTGNYFVIVYSKLVQEEAWTEMGKTENNTDQGQAAAFAKCFMCKFRAECQRELRFEAYRLRDANSIEDLAMQKYIGAAQAYLTEIIMARTKTATQGWFVRSLDQPFMRQGEKSCGSCGRICLFAEEDVNAKQTVAWSMTARNVKSTSVWKRRADAYSVINRTYTKPTEVEGQEDELELVPIFKSEVVQRNTNPKWKRMEFNSGTLCESENHREIIVEVYDHNRNRKGNYVGESVLCLNDILKSFRDSRAIVRPICVREAMRTAIFKKPGLKKRRSTLKPAFDGSRTSTSGLNSSAGTRRTSTNEMRRPRSLSGTKDSRGSRKVSILGSFSIGTSNSDRKTSTNSALDVDSLPSEATTDSKKSNKTQGPEFGKVVGELLIEEVGLMRSFSFVDYLRGGLEVKMLLAIDFTRSNKGPEVPESIHYQARAGSDSRYTTAIKGIVNVMQGYDLEGKFPVYGFGARIPPTFTACADVFALSGDFWDPEVSGVEGVMTAYQQALSVVMLHGPTKVRPVIKLCADMARPFADAITPPLNHVEMKYFVLIVLTDGEVHDKQDIVDEIMEASDLPMSVIFVDLGDNGEETFLSNLPREVCSRRKAQEAHGPTPKQKEKQEQLDAMMLQAEQQLEASATNKQGGFRRAAKKADMPKPAPPPRDVVNYVRSKDFAENPGQLAAAALAGIPREAIGYYLKRNVKPRRLDKYEDDTGHPVPKTVPTIAANKDGSKSNPASRTSTSLSTTSSARSGEAVSRSSSTLPGETKADKELRLRLEQLPPFLREERARIFKFGENLGYTPHQINRAFRDGLPAASVEALVDNIVNGGYGKNPTYKDLANQALTLARDSQMEALPGSPSEKVVEEETRTEEIDASITKQFVGARTSMMMRNGGQLISPMPFLDLINFSPSAEQSRMTTKTSSTTPSHKGSQRGTKNLPPSPQLQPASLQTPRPSRSKSILKERSREPSKDVEPTIPTIRPGHAASKESTSSRGSLRGAAYVHFQDEDANQTAPPAPAGTQPNLCAVCLEAGVAAQCVPCGHSFACMPCARILQESDAICQICSAAVRDVRRMTRKRN